MAGVEPNYFACTLGEAAILKDQRRVGPSFSSVLELIETQARTRPDAPALGFADPWRKEPGNEKPDLVTFLRLDNLSRVAAFELSRTVFRENARMKEEQNGFAASPIVVGLLCSSSLDFVLSWLGLLRLGYKAFFFAPQLQDHAIEYLCRETGIRTILVDQAHREQLSKVARSFDVTDIPDYYGKETSEPNPVIESTEAKLPSNVVFLQHTSGTSSGLPKPISMTEWGAVGCLPVFSDPLPKATFTTTPLYHGGIADALRAWTSGILVWFFPEGVRPITGANIREAVLFARNRGGTTPVAYFSSVPYVLQSLVEDEGCAGVALLKSMDLVGVGGAALAPPLGDRLVNSGVRLLSRMGSVECGFLMCSHRNYEEDMDWYYLRIPGYSNMLVFESREDGLWELVVTRYWPLRLKTNREDGSYATADLYEPHPRIPNGWRYHGRADALITLANGKKFDPSPLEDAVKSSCKEIREVLVFGEGKDRLGALLFANCQDQPDDEVFEVAWSAIQHSNSISPPYARLFRSMVSVHRVQEGTGPLPKSSKGTILRQQANGVYANLIEKAYSKSLENMIRQQISDTDLVSFITGVFEDTIGRRIDPENDIYAQGVDSIACISITAELQTALLPSQAPPLPRNIVYDSGTIYRLADRLRAMRSGDGHIDREGASPTNVMLRLSKKYSQLGNPMSRASKKALSGNGSVVVLTGATGALGAHILAQLIDNPEISRVYCLARGNTTSAVRRRIVAGLLKRQLGCKEELEYSASFQAKVFCFPSELSAPNLGLSAPDFSLLAHESTHIIHSAWPVNFSLGLESFEPQLEGLRNLIGLSSVGGARFFFISSIAAVTNTASYPISESVSSDPQDASSLGYSRSKWIAEQICAHTHGQAERPRITIIRVGQLCGNEHGVWNAKEAYPLILSTARFTACLPDLPQECLDWLPVDTAAKSVLEIVLSPGGNRFTDSLSSEPPVYHVLNPHRSPSWRQMLDWISQERGPFDFNVASASTWMERLEQAIATDPRLSDHPCQPLISIWKERYGIGANRESTGIEGTDLPYRFETECTQKVSSVIRDLKPLNRGEVVRMWNWVQNVMY